MKKIILCALFSIVLLNTYCQSKIFLTYFSSIENDSIFNTEEGQKVYYMVAQKGSLPDSISLKYIFDNNEEKMYGTEEGYNMDTGEYFTTTYIKKVKPLFKKKADDHYLLCYGLESKLYLGIYDQKSNKITLSIIISDFSDEMGNVVTHSIVFPNNYIAKTKIENKILYELIKIDYDVPEFKVLKKVEVNNVTENQKKIFEDALSALGITSKGEPVE